MPNEVDKSLLDRLAALRGPSASPPSNVVSSVSIDPIERKKTPTREEALADRLRRLREGSASPAASSPSQQSLNTVSRVEETKPPDVATKEPSLEYEGHAAGEEANEKSLGSMKDRLRAEGTGTTPGSSSAAPEQHQEPVEEDSYFQTDDAELEELLKDVHDDDPPPAYSEPTDQEVKDLLEQLSASVPQDDASTPEPSKVLGSVREEVDYRAEKDDSDDSDGEKMKGEVDDVIARYRDEMALEKDTADHQPAEESEQDSEDDDSGPNEGDSPVIDLPDVPATSAQPSAKPGDSTLDSLTSRLSALRNSNTGGGGDDMLPSVPSSAPTKEPNRLTSRTDYTDADMEKWCVVCLEDATLQCLGCDGEPYCVRCWGEMHVGERAGYEERGHKAVEFGKRKKKKVAIGA